MCAQDRKTERRYAECAECASEHRYRQGEYGSRFNHIQASRPLDAREYLRLSVLHNMSMCDVVTIYASTIATRPSTLVFPRGLLNDRAVLSPAI
jgi:hypothetical protein